MSHARIEIPRPVPVARPGYMNIDRLRALYARRERAAVTLAKLDTRQTLLREKIQHAKLEVARWEHEITRERDGQPIPDAAIQKSARAPVANS